MIFLSGDIHTGGAIDDGTWAKCPEMSVPPTNIPFGNTCHVVIPPRCGVWKCDSANACLAMEGEGYGIVEVNPSTQSVTLTTTSWDTGGSTKTSFIETISQGNQCNP